MGDAPPLWELRIWPHRSLTRAAYRGFFSWLLAGFGLALGMMAFAPMPGGDRWIYRTAFLIIFVFCAGAALLARWAIRRNFADRDLIGERLSISGDRLWLERVYRRRRLPPVSFSAHWVRVELTPGRHGEPTLSLRESGRVEQIGGFLMHDEREALSRDLSAALSDFRAGRPMPR